MIIQRSHTEVAERIGIGRFRSPLPSANACSQNMRTPSFRLLGEITPLRECVDHAFGILLAAFPQQIFNPALRGG